MAHCTPQLQISDPLCIVSHSTCTSLISITFPSQSIASHLVTSISTHFHIHTLICHAPSSNLILQSHFPSPPYPSLPYNSPVPSLIIPLSLSLSLSTSIQSYIPYVDKSLPHAQAQHHSWSLNIQQSTTFNLRHQYTPCKFVSPIFQP